MSVLVAWVSLNPVNPEINVYPPHIATKIEEAYLGWRQDMNIAPELAKIELGSAFYDATVHFSRTSFHCQTTPAQRFPGTRIPSKPPGYRSVQRIVCRQDGKISLKGKPDEIGEWRIVDGGGTLFEITVPITQLVTSRGDSAGEDDEPPHAVVVEELLPIWLWNKNTDYDIVHRSKETDWGFYPESENKVIENAWQNKEKEVDIVLGTVPLTIIFSPNSVYARQIHDKKERLVKRVTMSKADYETQSLQNSLESLRFSQLCSICLEEFSATPSLPVATTTCSHKFHSLCIQQIVDRHEPCPICRHHPLVIDQQLEKGIGRVFSWGIGSYGQLGHKNLDKSGVCEYPTLINELTDLVDVACGEMISGVINKNGELYLWGKINDHILFRPTLIAALANFKVTSLAIGTSHVLCVAGPSGNLYSFGKNTNGCLGPKVSTDFQNPTQVYTDSSENQTPIQNIIQVACSHHASAAVTSDGLLYTWGLNQFGKLGLGKTDESVEIPTLVNIPPVSFVSMGTDYTGALSMTGDIWLWGSGKDGNLGTNDRLDRSSPVRLLTSDGPFISLSCSVTPRGYVSPKDSGEGAHTVAVNTQGKVFTWGSSHHGVLGNHANHTQISADELAPYQIGGFSRDTREKTNYLSETEIVQVGASNYSTFCLSKDGVVYSFGCTHFPSLYIENNWTHKPVSEGTLTDAKIVVQKIAVSANHVLVLAKSS
eukprot:c20405_g1_i1.p1 GENE.c20405_g1_i1~~c20405_g1_i1.p1  ORF type:complete len:711 (-),score=311.33 c20405_g1_i1:64-2196(-)